jgi:glycosyltransferase involved in cell wall biosynthesis
LRILTLLESTELLGGREIVHLGICRALAARGHEIHLLHRTSGSMQAEWEQVATSVGSLPAEGIRPDIRRPWRSLPAYARLVRAGRALHPDVVYVPARLLLVAAASIGTATRAPVVAHLHDPPHALDWQNRLAVGRITSFIAVSAAQAAAWRAVGVAADRTTVVYNGVDLDRFHPVDVETRAARRRALGLGDDLAVPVVAYVGRLAAQKGVDVLIDAVGAVGEDRRPVLVIAGDGDHVDGNSEARQGHRSVHGQARMLVIGRVAAPEAVLQAADLVVLPSRYPDPFPLAAIEALACGVPVIASAVGGLPESVGMQGDRFLVPADDIRLLTERLTELVGWRIDDPDLGDRARGIAERSFSATTMVDRIEDALERASDRVDQRLSST